MQVRLAQAHARLMFHEVVTVMDAVVAVTLMETSMQACPQLLLRALLKHPNF